jgi:hydroxylamine reductase
MFCHQCEQTAKGEGCTKAGVCGKPQDVATLQDLLVYALVGLSIAASEARRKGIVDHEADVFTVKALFSTLTNVNFDADRFVPMIRQAVQYRDGFIGKVKASGGSLDLSIDALAFKPSGTMEGLVEQGEKAGLMDYPAANADILSLKHTLLFGI